MMRLRRSELATPGSSEHMIAKAAASDADQVFLDLEDACAPEEKGTARETVSDALNGLDWGDTIRSVRINAIASGYGYDDLVHLVAKSGERLQVVIVPKLTGRDEVVFIDTLLTQLERKHGIEQPIGLEILIEEVEGLAEVERIATASPRIETLIFGPGDFSGSQGVRTTLLEKRPDFGQRLLWLYARSRIVAAAKTAGVMAIDGPYADFHDHDGYRQCAEEASIMGFQGKWAVHPDQITIANDVYSPTSEEIEWARHRSAAYTEAEQAGDGAISVDGELVDAAHMRIYANILDMAELIAERER